MYPYINIPVHTRLTYVPTPFIHSAVCLATGPKPLPKPVLHTVRSSAYNSVDNFSCPYIQTCIQTHTHTQSHTYNTYVLKHI